MAAMSEQERPPPEPPNRAAPLALWRVAQEFINWLYMLFGAPEKIAAKYTLPRKLHAQMLTWLRAGEALLRKLVLIEAAALAPLGPCMDVAACEPSAPRRPSQRSHREPVPLDPSQPEQWRVSFRLVARQRIAGERNRRERSYGSRLVRSALAAAPLARRFEALLRVFNEPLPYARRLARQLQAEPERAQAILTHPADAPALVGHGDFDEVHTAAKTASDVLAPRPRRESG